MYKEEKELWVKFACAALTNCVSTLEGRIDDWNAKCKDPGDWVDEEDQIAEDCSSAAQYADEMVSMFYDKFKGC